MVDPGGIFFQQKCWRFVFWEILRDVCLSFMWKNVGGLVPWCSKSHSNVQQFRRQLGPKKLYQRNAAKLSEARAKKPPFVWFLWLLRYVCNRRGGEGQLKKPRKKWCRNFLRWKNVTWSHLRHFMKWSFLEAVADQLKAAGVQAANLLEEPVDLLPPARSPSLFQQRYDLWPTRFATPVGDMTVVWLDGFSGFETGVWNGIKVHQLDSSNLIEHFQIHRSVPRIIYIPLWELTYTLLKAFWVNDFPNFPFGGICFLVPWSCII